MDRESIYDLDVIIDKYLRELLGHDSVCVFRILCGSLANELCSIADLDVRIRTVVSHQTICVSCENNAEIATMLDFLYIARFEQQIRRTASEHLPQNWFFGYDEPGCLLIQRIEPRSRNL